VRGNFPFSCLCSEHLRRQEEGSRTIFSFSNAKEKKGKGRKGKQPSCTFPVLEKGGEAKRSLITKMTGKKVLTIRVSEDGKKRSDSSSERGKSEKKVGVDLGCRASKQREEGEVAEHAVFFYQNQRGGKREIVGLSQRSREGREKKAVILSLDRVGGGRGEGKALFLY